MKSLRLVLLTSALFTLPLVAHAAADAASAADATQTIDCPMHDEAMAKHGGMHHGMHGSKHHGKPGGFKHMTTEQLQAHLKERFERIEDPVKKAEFIKRLTERSAAMTARAQVLKTFAEANQ
ncbi:MAG: hypothetical protein ACRCYV_12210 [Aeromonas sp.]